MDLEQKTLYTNIQMFSLDPPGAELGFSQRLARDNGWTLDYANSVIAEYKKFAFLAVVADHPVTPSDQVDQAWHLHLTYTQSYWQAFCPNVLKKPLHHNPTKGGSQEHIKFDQWYTKTLNSYKHFFGDVPPVDVWPKPTDRFGRDTHFVRVNTQQNWVIPKPQLWTSTANFLHGCRETIRGQGDLSGERDALALPRTLRWAMAEPSHREIAPTRKLKVSSRFHLLGIMAIALLLTGCTVTADIPFNPFNFRGPVFLLFYGGLSLFVVLASHALRDWLLYNPEVEQKLKELNPYEVAYYTAGERRVIATAITSLLEQEVIETDGIATVSIKKPRKKGKLPLEREVYQAIADDGNIYSVTDSTLPLVTKLGDRVSQIIPSISRQKRLAAFCLHFVPTPALLGLGIIKINIGLSRHQPVGFLTYICFAIGFFAFTNLVSKTIREHERNLNLRKLRAPYRAPSESLAPNHNVLLGFALLGRFGLPNSGELGVLKKVFVPKATGAYGGASGCGGGGCGGGGCGGCGG